ncbi:hypothetical protein ACH4RA_34435 [Streptomyces smyrnaeus]|uniref:hypothetical protein n=1 Tax=Streptomyces smyrnaeus TaxID=1387713 RepID=UPI0037BBC5C4
MSVPRRRVYGSDHDDPHPYARPGHDYREMVGGPLDVTGVSWWCGGGGLGVSRG